MCPLLSTNGTAGSGYPRPQQRGLSVPLLHLPRDPCAQESDVLVAKLALYSPHAVFLWVKRGLQFPGLLILCKVHFVAGDIAAALLKTNIFL